MRENHRIKGGIDSFLRSGDAASTGRISCHLHGLTQHYSPSLRSCTHSSRAATSSRSMRFLTPYRRPMLNLINRLILICLLAVMVAGAEIKAENELREGCVYRLKTQLTVKSILPSRSAGRDYTLRSGALIHLTGKDSSGVWEIRPLDSYPERTVAYKTSTREHVKGETYRVASYEELFKAPDIQPTMAEGAWPSTWRSLDRDFAYRWAVQRLKDDMNHMDKHFAYFDQREDKYFAQIHISDIEHSQIIETAEMYLVCLYFEGVNRFGETTHFRHEQRIWHRSDEEKRQHSIMSAKIGPGQWWERETYTKSPRTGKWHEGYRFNPENL